MTGKWDCGKAFPRPTKSFNQKQNPHVDACTHADLLLLV